MTLIVLSTSQEVTNRRDSSIADFDFYLKGVLLEKNSIDHNDARVIVLVKESKFSAFNGADYLGRKIEVQNDTASMTLMRDDCLFIGDSIFFGPQDNYIIKRYNSIIYDRKKGIDDCYVLNNAN